MKTYQEKFLEQTENCTKFSEVSDIIWNFVDQVINDQYATHFIEKRLVGRGSWRVSADLNYSIVGRDVADYVQAHHFTTYDEDKEFTIADFSEELYNAFLTIAPITNYSHI